jgi:hypothetical protein
MKYPTIAHIRERTSFKTAIRARGALEALKWLEAGAPHKLDGLPGTFSFNMSHFLNSHAFKPEGTCGTACCIAGAIHAFTKKMDGDKDRFLAPSDLREIFDLKYDNDLYRLFYAEGSRFDLLRNIKPEDAAVVLRRYLETGEVDWGLV